MTTFTKFTALAVAALVMASTSAMAIDVTSALETSTTNNRGSATIAGTPTFAGGTIGNNRLPTITSTTNTAGSSKSAISRTLSSAGHNSAALAAATSTRNTNATVAATAGSPAVGASSAGTGTSRFVTGLNQASNSVNSVATGVTGITNSALALASLANTTAGAVNGVAGAVSGNGVSGAPAMSRFYNVDTSLTEAGYTRARLDGIQQGYAVMRSGAAGGGGFGLGSINGIAGPLGSLGGVGGFGANCGTGISGGLCSASYGLQSVAQLGSAFGINTRGLSRVAGGLNVAGGLTNVQNWNALGANLTQSVNIAGAQFEAAGQQIGSAFGRRTPTAGTATTAAATASHEAIHNTSNAPPPPARIGPPGP